jgi:ankyrin repeat protein
LINKPDQKGFTPFYYACAGSKKRNNIDIIKFLLDSNPNVNIDSKSYAFAALRNNEDAKKYIQEYLKKNHRKIPE